MDSGLAGLIMDVVDASTRPERWDAVCDRMVDRYDVRLAVLFEYDLTTQIGANVHMSRALSENAMDLMARFASGDSAEDLAIQEATTKIEPGRFMTEADVLREAGSPAPINNPFRDTLLERTGAAARWGGRMNDVGPWVDVASLYPSTEDPGHFAKVQPEMNLLLGVLGKAFETNRMIRRLSGRFESLLSTFDKLNFGVAFCEPDGRVAFANQRFEHMARARDGITTKGGVIGATHPGDHPRLRALLETAVYAPTRPSDLIATLRRASGLLPFIVRVAPALDPGRDRRRSLTLVLVVDPEDRNLISADGLQALGQLSDEERMLCDLLVQGMPVEEIARESDLPSEDAGRMLTDLSARLACRSRLDMVRLAMSTSAPVSLGETRSSLPAGT